MGTYPRLPTCIKERILTLPPLEGEEEEEAHQLINCAIRHRLANQHIPENMTVISISEYTGGGHWVGMDGQGGGMDRMLVCVYESVSSK